MSENQLKETTTTKQSVGSYIFQNPLMNPTNGIKSVGPSPVLSTEMLWSENENLYEFNTVDKKAENPDPYLLIPKKPEGWDEFVHHNNFIEDMFYNVQKETEVEEQSARIHAEAKELKNKKQDMASFSQKQTSNANADTSKMTKPRRLEAPWRQNTNSFSSPSAMRRQTFENFLKMSPDPPKTLLGHTERHAKITPELPRKKEPPTPKKLEQHTVIGPRMELVPLKNITSSIGFSKPKSLPLPSNKTTVPGPSVLEKGAIRLQKKSPLNINPMTPNNLLLQQLALEEKTRVPSHPMPFSKRREYFPQNQPTLYHTVYYGNGKRNSGQMPPQVKVKQMFPINGRKDMTSELKKFLTPQNSKLNENGKFIKGGNQPARKIRPAMLFPFHVPGPKHDNIYIGEYQGSDTESEPDVSTNNEPGIV